MKKITIVLLSLVLPVSIISCGPSDDKINEAVKTALAGNGALGTVTTTVTDGVVTLRGEVDNDELKALAETTVREVKGVKSVTNSLSVKPQGPSPEELKRLADEALQARVNDAFTRYKVTGITAAVTDSIVTLTGDIKRADLQNAMKAAMEAAPKKVENKMNIK
jgi:osmotically-inducible protein OsmY